MTADCIMVLRRPLEPPPFSRSYLVKRAVSLSGSASGDIAASWEVNAQGKNTFLKTGTSLVTIAASFTVIFLSIAFVIKKTVLLRTIGLYLSSKVSRTPVTDAPKSSDRGDSHIGNVQKVPQTADTRPAFPDQGGTISTSCGSATNATGLRRRIRGTKGRPEPERLLEAIYLGDTEIVNALFGAGADINHVAHSRQHLLNMAITDGNQKMLRLLCDLGPQLDPIFPQDKTALLRAIHTGEFGAAEILINAGADLKASTEFNQTPLHFAVTQHSERLTNLLLHCGADFEAKVAAEQVKIC